MLSLIASMFFDKIAAVVQWIADLWKAIFKAAWDLLRDGACWVFEEGLKVAVSAAAGINTSGITTSLSAWNEVPAEMLNVLQLLGVGSAIAIITTAIGIRLVLQLIPFTRLGS